jgi:3'(2'), 5'-bisphosphate nucleotidase
MQRIGHTEPVPLGSSLKFCRIAEGAMDVYPRFGPTSEWDTAAGQCVLEAAGGVVIDPRGRPLRYNQRDTILNGDFLALGDPQLPWRDWL